MRFFLLPALLLAAEACTENGHVSAPGLQPWEVALLKDCPVSALGDVRPFNVTSGNPTAQAHFALGLKALHNFFYDMCKYAFAAALAASAALRRVSPRDFSLGMPLDDFSLATRNGELHDVARESDVEVDGGPGARARLGEGPALPWTRPSQPPLNSHT